MNLNAILDAIDAIYQTASEPETWPQVLLSIAVALDSKGALLLSRRDDGALTTLVSPNLLDAQADYEAGWWRHDFLAHRAISQGFYDRGDIVTEQDVSSEEERQTHPFYTEFRKPHGLGGLIAGSISPVPSTLVVLVAHQAYGQPSYTRDHAHLIERLIKHCERSLVLSCRLEELRRVNDTLIDALNKLNCGVFVLDHAGRCTHANPAGENLIQGGIQLVNRKLWLRDEAARKALDLAVASALSSEVEDRLGCSRPVVARQGEGLRPVVFYVLPLRTEQAAMAWSPLPTAAALVIAVDIAVSGDLNPSLVRDYLGLTLGEARIASHIGLGLSPRDAADKLAISEQTVRTTLKKIFAKTGVSRQSELTLLLSRLHLLDLSSQPRPGA